MWTFSVRIPATYIEPVMKAAEKEGLSLSQFIRKCIDLYLQLQENTQAEPKPHPQSTQVQDKEKIMEEVKEVIREVAKPLEKTGPPGASPPPTPRASLPPPEKKKEGEAVNLEKISEEVDVILADLMEPFAAIDSAIRSFNNDDLARSVILSRKRGYEKIAEKVDLVLFKAKWALEEDIPRLEKTLAALEGKAPREKLAELREKLEKAKKLAETYVGFFERKEAWLPPKI